MASVAEEFREKGITRGGELHLRATDAIAFVRRCRDRGIQVLGVDAFHLTDTTRQPDMHESIDLTSWRDPLSSWRDPAQSSPTWDRAEQFLSPRIATELYFVVVTDEK